MSTEADSALARSNSLPAATTTAAADGSERREKRLRLERSPHPYHRRSVDAPERIYSSSSTAEKERRESTQYGPGSPVTTASSSAAAQQRAEQYAEHHLAQQHPDSAGASGYFDDSDGRKRRKLGPANESPPPNDSGTEADDEKPLLKALTAPPLRPRKGLKSTYTRTGSGGPGQLSPQGYSSSTDPLASPLLTPSILQEEDVFRSAYIQQRAGSIGSQKGQYSRRASAVSVGDHNEEADRILREKFRRRGRAELGRRVLETLSLGAIGAISFIGAPAEYRLAMRMHLLLIVGVYAWYMLWLWARQLWRRQQRRPQSTSDGGSLSSWALPRIYFPAASDPAPLLYPVLVPIFVAMTMAASSSPSSDNPHSESSWPTIVHANFILSLCAIPRKVIPWQDSNIHWLLSMVPTLYTQWLQSSTTNADPESERFTFLFPLHQTLLPPLAFLTTTSLLSTELQLLSVALINLLLFSTAPQAVILKALLWIGGLALFTTSRYVLSWSVGLARVPSWRFRKAKSPGWAKGRRVGLMAAVDDTFGGWVSELLKAAVSGGKGKGTGKGGHSSEDEESEDDTGEGLEWRRKSMLRKRDSYEFRQQQKPHRGTSQHHHHKQQSVSTDRVTRGDFAVLEDSPVSAVPAATRTSLDDSTHRSHNTTALQDKINLHLPTPPTTPDYMQPSSSSSLRPRRYTLPAAPSALPDFPTLRRSAALGLRALRNQAKAKSYLSLTSAQAAMLKWLYASYTYLVVLVTVLVPIRLYVAAKALGGREPVGWALGYMFGDLEPFRLWVMASGLDAWICLPVHMQQQEAEATDGSAVSSATTRLLLSGYYVLSIALGLTLVFRLSSVADVDTRRKVFHGMMVSMFGATTFVDPCFVACAFALALALFLLLDLFRASQLPPLSKPLTVFLAPYVDGRDHRGPVIVSHVFLLIGCAVPLWLSLAAAAAAAAATTPGGVVPASAFHSWDVPTRDLGMVAGIICVGMGDAAASLIGRRFGRRRWPWSGGKSLEGSLAFALAVVLGLSAARVLLVCGGWQQQQQQQQHVGQQPERLGWRRGWDWIWMAKACVAACGASLTEAVLTGANDNVLVPVVLWLLVQGLGV